MEANEKNGATVDVAPQSENLSLEVQKDYENFISSHGNSEERFSQAKEIAIKMKSSPEYENALREKSPDLARLCDKRVTRNAVENTHDALIKIESQNILDQKEVPNGIGTINEMGVLVENDGKTPLPEGWKGIVQNENDFYYATGQGDTLKSMSATNLESAQKEVGIITKLDTDIDIAFSELIEKDQVFSLMKDALKKADIHDLGSLTGSDPEKFEETTFRRVSHVLSNRDIEPSDPYYEPIKEVAKSCAERAEKLIDPELENQMEKSKQASNEIANRNQFLSSENSQEQLIEHANADLQNFNQITNTVDKELALTHMGEAYENHPAYRDTILKESPNLAPALEEINAANKQLVNSREAVKDLAAFVKADAKVYAPRENGKYTGKIVKMTETHALQQLRESNSYIAHPLKNLDGAKLESDKNYLMEYKDGKLLIKEPEIAKNKTIEKNTQDQGKPVESELVKLKNELAGKDAKLVMAKDENGKAYTGVIIAEHGNKVLQRVSEKYVVVHEKDKLSKDVEVGSTKRLAYEEGKINVLEPSQERSKATAQEKDRAGEKAPDQGKSGEEIRKESFFQARGIVMQQFGESAKLRDAKPDIGDYKGAVVAITSKHVVQQLGANSFVAHEKDRLAGTFNKGAHVAIKYNNGRAIAALTQQQRDQSKSQSITR